jgi:plasmid stability protein
MTDVLVPDLEDEVVERLRRRAIAKGRPLEEELRDILRAEARRDRSELLARLDEVRSMTPAGPPIDSTAMIREDRDSR